MTLNAAKKENFYRCPACGELVDNRRREEIHLHHDHVLHPALDRYVKLPTVSPSQFTTPREVWRV